jgi:hypothetical protein
MKKDLNYIAKLEKAIGNKYGQEAIQNPRSSWTEEKEKDYLEQIKQIYKLECTKSKYFDRIEKEGFFVTKKLFSKENDRVCTVCHEFSFELKDDVYMNRFDCCNKCYIKFVEHREERWLNLSDRVEFLSAYYSRRNFNGNNI